MARTQDAGTPGSSRASRVLSAIDDALRVPVEELDDPGCEREMQQLDVALKRLQARQTALFGVMRERRAEAAREEARRNRTDPERAAHRAKREVDDEVMDELNWPASRTKQVSRDADRLKRYPLLAAVFDEGGISRRHVTIAADLLDKFLGDDRGGGLEIELVEHAQRMDPVAFADHCRRRLAELDHDRATREQGRRHARRSARMATGPDGMLHLRADLAGMEAAIVARTIKSFRTPDGANTEIQHRRTPEQVTADALVGVCRAASGDAHHADVPADGSHSDTGQPDSQDSGGPTSPRGPAGDGDDDRRNRENGNGRHRHGGGRPHGRATAKQHATAGNRTSVVVTIDYRTLLAEAGSVDVEEIGSLPFSEIRRLLADAGVSRILVDPEGVPVEAGREVRTVPAGLRRALVLRDRGCVTRGCRTPPEWCEVAHLEQPYRHKGRLSLTNAALLCPLHHRRFDLHGWRLRWRGNRPEVTPPSDGSEPDDADVAQGYDERSRAEPSTEQTTLLAEGRGRYRARSPHARGRHRTRSPCARGRPVCSLRGEPPRNPIPAREGPPPGPIPVREGKPDWRGALRTPGWLRPVPR